MFQLLQYKLKLSPISVMLIPIQLIAVACQLGTAEIEGQCHAESSVLYFPRKPTV
jgi:hypothetical protein